MMYKCKDNIIIGDDFSGRCYLSNNKVFAFLVRLTKVFIFQTYNTFLGEESFKSEKVIQLKAKFTNNTNKWYKNKVP